MIPYVLQHFLLPLRVNPLPPKLSTLILFRKGKSIKYCISTIMSSLERHQALNGLPYLRCIVMLLILQLSFAKESWLECPSVLTAFPEGTGKWRVEKIFEFNLTGSPTVSSWDPDRIDLFVKGTDNQLWYSSKTGNTEWTSWETLGGDLLYSPAAISHGTGLIKVYAVGADRQLEMIEFKSGKWGDWEKLGSSLNGTPAIGDDGTGSFGVVVPGLECTGSDTGTKDHKLCIRPRDENANAWGTWGEFLEGQEQRIRGPILQVPRFTNMIHDFGRGSNDNKLYHRTDCCETLWTKIDDAELGSAPGGISLNPGRIDLFAVMNGGHLVQKMWNGVQVSGLGQWSKWTKITGVKVMDRPAVISRQPNEIELFVRGADDNEASSSKYYYITFKPR